MVGIVVDVDDRGVVNLLVVDALVVVGSVVLVVMVGVVIVVVVDGTVVVTTGVVVGASVGVVGGNVVVIKQPKCTSHKYPY